jgi:UDP-glucose 4-epimerase
MKILVTGGGGFLGMHLVDSLLEEDYTVSILDIFKESKKIQNPKVEVFEEDITNYESVNKCLKGFDTIIHLAAKASVSESISNPELVNLVNVTGSLNLLKACKNNNIQNFIAASSASVYGKTLDNPISEHTITKPISPYGASKLSMEAYMSAFSHSFNLNTIGLRFFNIYGMGQSSKYGGVIKKFSDQINENKDIQISGDGENTRDFIHVSDVVKSISLSIKNINKKKGAIYNIASGESISIINLAKIMIKISNKNIKIHFKGAQEGDIKDSSAKIELAKRELGFNPTVLLEEGLRDMINHE